MNYGVFMRANYQDGLSLGSVTDGLVGSVFIKNVPRGYSEADIETLVLCNGLGFQFGQGLHQHVVLAEADFPSSYRFQTDVHFDGLFSGAIKELTKQRLARQKAA